MTTKEKLTPQELEHNLAHFTGTGNYYVWSALFKRFVLTEGAQYLAEEAGAHWLMDIIGSYQGKLLKKQEHFQVWILTVNAPLGGSAVVVATDGNDNRLVKQEIPYTDFPLDGIKLYACWDGSYLVIMLPSEY